MTGDNTMLYGAHTLEPITTTKITIQTRYDRNETKAGDITSRKQNVKYILPATLDPSHGVQVD